MSDVKTWDVVIVGGGIIGLSLARSLRKHGASVLVVEKGEPGREASWAAGGMLAPIDPHSPPLVQRFGLFSAGLYREFVQEIADESRMKVDFRHHGTIVFVPPDRASEAARVPGLRPLAQDELARLEPALETGGAAAFFLQEASVDPRELMAALLAAARHRGVEVAHGEAATGIEVEGGRATAVTAANTKFAAGAIVNCAGAWAAQVGPVQLPVKPIRGQMLSLIPARRDVLRHVVRSGECYIVPRSDGRVVIGSTLEDAGFDKRTDAATIQRLHQAATRAIPALAEARLHEDWAGLRPASSDDLPILGCTAIDGYFAATGHHREGILLAPATARVMTELIRGTALSFDIAPFSPARFSA
jgi:glycine oxidase